MKRSERIAELYAKNRAKFWAVATFREAKKAAGCAYPSFCEEKIKYWTGEKSKDAPTVATKKVMSAEEVAALRKRLENTNKRAAEMAAKIKEFEESAKR